MLTLKTDELFKSIQSGNLEEVKEMVAADPSLVNTKHRTGATGILFALYNGHKEIAEFLARRKPDLDIFEAACLGRIELVKALVEADPRMVKAYSGEGFTALGLVAYMGQKEVAQYLVDSGAEVNAIAKNQTGFTALTGAVTNGYADIAEMLLVKSANVNHRYEAGLSPLMIATHNGNLELTRILLAHGADDKARTNDGKTALSYALEKGHSDVAAFLREHGAKE